VLLRLWVKVSVNIGSFRNEPSFIYKLSRLVENASELEKLQFKLELRVWGVSVFNIFEELKIWELFGKVDRKLTLPKKSELTFRLLLGLVSVKALHVLFKLLRGSRVCCRKNKLVLTFALLVNVVFICMLRGVLTRFGVCFV
tara:strand:- start:435 stop:860 length:426 start_codon:yes stop_codon:yes gene_type:complete